MGGDGRSGKGNLVKIIVFLGPESSPVGVIEAVNVPTELFAEIPAERLPAPGAPAEVASLIRIAEFSWHLMEPAEGQYDFSFFDRVIAKAREKNLKVILGTPTATIPAWLASKYPDIPPLFWNPL